MQPKLWTRNFTAITAGSVISMMGNAVSGFAMQLLILQRTGTFLYALFAMVTQLPYLLVPLLAGPYLDKFSRRRVVILADTCNGLLLVGVALLLWSGFFDYLVFLLIGVVVGVVGCVHTVAYESFYPCLIQPGCYAKAYSVSSLIYPLATTAMVPLAGNLYKVIGIAPLLLFDGLTFFGAALLESRVRVAETCISPETRRTLPDVAADWKEGLHYLKSEPGLRAVTAYFIITTFVGGVVGTLLLPFFNGHPTFTATDFSWVMAFSTAGRIVGGLVQYRFRLPARWKFAIAAGVYTTLSFLEGTQLFLPLFMIMAFQFLSGMLAVTSYNIRISATQHHLPDHLRARFNGLFLMLTTLGMLVGQLLAGVLASLLPIPFIVLGFHVLNLVAVALVVLRNKKPISALYNVEL